MRIPTPRQKHLRLQLVQADTAVRVHNASYILVRNIYIDRNALFLMRP